MVNDIIIPLTIFITAGIVLFKFLHGRHLERMAMIERGVSLSNLKGNLRFSLEMPAANNLANLKWSLLAIFVGVGLLVANILYRRDIMDGAAYPMFMLIFGGIGLLVFYLDAKRVIKKEEEGRKQQLRDADTAGDK